MSYDLDDLYENRVKPKKRKKRNTYPNKHDAEYLAISSRRKSDPLPFISDDSSAKCVIKEYSKNRLTKEIVITKHSKIHPKPDDAVDPENDMVIVTKCLAIVSKKVVRLLCYLSALV